MKKLIDRLGLPRVIGIAGLALLIVIFLRSRSAAATLSLRVLRTTPTAAS